MLARKYRIHIFLLLLSLGIIFYPMYHKKPAPEQLTASTQAALDFLQLVDEGLYQQSWRAASAYLRNDIDQQAWVEQLQAVRSATGQLIERTRTDYFATQGDQEGIPAGDYMVLTFSSRFANRDELKETVTLILEDDQIWRVAGYFID